MKAKKLPSGNWRARAYYTENGKKICRSFTAETKKEAQYLASAFLMEKREKARNGMTLGEAIDDYITNKQNILSPSSIDSYKRIKKNSLNELCSIYLSELEPDIIQKHFNKLSQTKAPKTVSNAHGLLASVLNVYAPEIHLNTTLPKKQKKIKNFPAIEDVIRIIKGTEIELPCLLAIWQGLRMSEVRGIKKSDIKNGILTINRVIVTVNRQNIEKSETKTYDSKRQLQLPEYILNLIEKSDTEYITELTGQAIYKRLDRLLRKNGLEHISFHDLRHLNASVMLALNIPDKYAMERGGWSSTNIMKSVYQHTFSDERKEIDRKIDGFFYDIIEKVDTKADTHF